jgi:ADP-heptose:LPS heptosyltransferase
VFRTISVSDAAVKKILVIRKHNHLGDMLCSLPLYAALKQRWPDCGITLLAAPTSYPVPLREINPYLDDVILYHKTSVAAVIRVHLRLRRERFDMVIVPSTIRLSRTSHITARITGTPVRVGVRSIDGVANTEAKWLTDAIDTAWESQRVHQVWRNIDIASAAGCARTENPLRHLHIPPTPEAVREARTLLDGFPESVRIVGVHPGAGKEANIWPAERFASVLASLHGEHPVAVVVSGGSQDAPVVQQLSRLLDEQGIAYRIVEPLAVISAVAGQLGLFLTNDTGIMHVAAFSGARVVSLFGPTPAWEWAPLQEHCVAIQSRDGSMKGISVAEVLAACRGVLA